MSNCASPFNGSRTTISSMAFKRDEVLTAVKVRGKRHARIAEKWTSGKRRNADLQKRPPLSQPASLNQTGDSTKSRKRKPKSLEEESPLERLPAEVLQQVFEYSGNVELPLVSRELASKLSRSSHLQHQLTSQLLDPVLNNPAASASDLNRASRLLNSRFMTWQFFTTWVRARMPCPEPDDTTDASWSDSDTIQAWLALQPSPALLPPRKLLSSPFNHEKTQFLAAVSDNIQDLAGMDAAYGELGLVGLLAAVRQGQGEVISLLLSMGLNPTKDILRVAVTESDCDKDIVSMLVKHAGGEQSSHAVDSASSIGIEGSSEAIDLLDPVLWAWADEARRRGNAKGKWLIHVLQYAQQLKDLASKTSQRIAPEAT